MFIDHPVHLKFNVSLGKAALVGIYGRKGLPPSHTQVMGLQFNNCLKLCVLMAYCFISAVYCKDLLHASKMLNVICPEKDNQVTTAEFTHINSMGYRHGQAGGYLRQQAARGGKGVCGLVVTGHSW